MAKQNAKTKQLDDLGIEQICEYIEAGKSQSEIARALDIWPSQLTKWIDSDDERSARAKLARQRSAEGWMDRGLKALVEIPDDGTGAQIARAREIAQHCRKMAAIRNPQYSDKTTIVGDSDNPLQVINKIERRVIKPTHGDPSN